LPQFSRLEVAMSRLSAAVTAILIWLIFPAALFAQRMGSADPSQRHLSGTVYLENNRPADHVTVELRSTSGSMIAPGITSSSGSFEFYDLASASYALAINQQGYQPIEVTVDLTLTSSNGVLIYLKPLANNPPSAASRSTISTHELSMPQKARDLMDSGKKKLHDKDAQGALDDFQEAVSTAPDYYEAHYEIALAYLTIGKPDDAEKSFRKSIDVSGDKYSEADVGLGKIMLDKGDIPAGEKLARRGIELNASSWQGYYELGRAQLNAKQLADAQKSAEQARALAPGAPVVYRLLANIHQQEKDFPSLLQDLDAYIKLDPDSPAGTRAKQMRDEVQQKIAAQTSSDIKP
jgi:tetratricopeptide (TPR) repeat protein